MNTPIGSTGSWHHSHSDTSSNHLRTPNVSSSTSDSSSYELSPRRLAHRYGTVEDEYQTVSQDGGHYEDEYFTVRITQIIEHMMLSIGLGIGTYSGVVLRIYLSYLSQWDGVQHFPSLWAQIIGSALMGTFIGYKDRLLQYSVIYTSLTTGLCGSLTTFSSWNSEASMVLLQLNETSLSTLNSNNYLHGTVGCFTVLLLGTGLPISALLLGRNIAQQSTPTNTTISVSNSNSSVKRKCILLLLFFTLFMIASGSIITSCVLTGNYYIMFSLLLGWPGTYIRWCLSKLDSYLKSGFPLGTFLANTLGSLILASTLVARAYVVMETNTSVIALDLLSGVITGFCGSLTTVSSFVSQLVKIRFKIAVIYTLVSLSVAQVVFTVILGSYSWTM